jgi:hypothetical protein
MMWQPIETAPKDATDVVLWVEVIGTGGGYPVPRSFYCEGRWWYCDDDSHPLEDCEFPTHWFKILPPEKEPKQAEDPTCPH